MTARVAVLGCPVDLLTRDETKQQLLDATSADTFLHIVTLNPEQIMAALADKDMAQTISAAEAIVVDGVGLAIALKLAGYQPVERITGVQLVEWICELGVPAYFLGGAPGASEEAKRRMAERYPESEIMGAWSGGSAEPADDARTIERIIDSGAMAILVAYGAPAQLLWIERNRNPLHAAGIRIAIGVGGTFDYLSGQVALPPAWVRKSGLEWLARLINQPWRWRRQLVLPRFAVLATVEAARRRMGRI